LFFRFELKWDDCVCGMAISNYFKIIKNCYHVGAIELLHRSI